MNRRLLCLALLAFASLVAGIAGATDEGPAAEAAAAPAAVAAVATDPPAAEPARIAAPPPASCAPGSAGLPLTEPGKIPVQIGCHAEYNCVHGTTVDCTSPFVGTCISTGQHCGGVSCNGVVKWCPGYCLSDANCYNFCGGASSPGSHCDEYGCCVCE